MKLPELLSNDTVFQDAVRRSCQLVDDEVQSKSGVSGMTIKGAYKLFKGVKPGFLEAVVRDLLPDFAQVLDPFYERASAESQTAQAYFTTVRHDVAEALLAVTDKRAEKSQVQVLRSGYNKLRATASKHVAEAAPRVGHMLDEVVRSAA